MKARIRRISASVDTALSPTSDQSAIHPTTTAVSIHTDSNLTPEFSSNTSSYGYNTNPTSKVCLNEIKFKIYKNFIFKWNFFFFLNSIHSIFMHIEPRHMCTGKPY